MKGGVRAVYMVMRETLVDLRYIFMYVNRAKCAECDEEKESGVSYVNWIEY